MIANSIEELNANISSVMEQILHEITAELNAELHDTIEEKVYEAYKGWYYEMGYRTNEFLESFVVENFDRVMFGGNTTLLTEEIINDPTLMTEYTGFPYSHHQRDELAEIIETGEGYLFDTDAPPRPFWEDWVNWCMVQIPLKFQQKCASKGINLM